MTTQQEPGSARKASRFPGRRARPSADIRLSERMHSWNQLVCVRTGRGLPSP